MRGVGCDALTTLKEAALFGGGDSTRDGEAHPHSGPNPIPPDSEQNASALHPSEAFWASCLHQNMKRFKASKQTNRRQHQVLHSGQAEEQ